jgi:streptogramin lyase
MGAPGTGVKPRTSWPAATLCLAACLLALLGKAAPAAAFHTPGTTETGITAGPDGNLWAAFRGEGAGLYKVSVSGQISQVGAGSPEGPLVTGSDGNLWTAVEKSAYGGVAGFPGIARIAPGGGEAFFPPPEGVVNSTRYETGGLSADPDGNIWFTSNSVNGENEQIRVSRITPTGQVTELPIPLSLAPGVTTQNELAPREIASGAGAAWLLSERGLTRVTPEGQMSFLPVPATVNGHVGLTFGPDGNLWATYATRTSTPSDPRTLEVRRITPEGAVTTFPSTYIGHEQAVGITSGPDGNLWVANGARILRITTAGVVTEFPSGLPGLPYGDGAEAITAGPDGNLWFTGRTAIGRITIIGSVTVFPLPGITQPPSGPIAQCVVPNLQHKTLAQAKKLLVRSHCALGKVSRPKKQTKKRRKHKLVVLSQKPVAKKTMAAGSTVSVKLGSAEAFQAQTASTPKTAFQCEKRFKAAAARSQCFNQLPGASCAHPLEVQKTYPNYRGDTKDFTVSLTQEPDGDETVLLSYKYAPKKNVAICPHGAVFKVSLLSQTEHCERTPKGEEVCSEEYDTKNIPEPATKAGGGFTYEMTGQPVKSWYLAVTGYFVHPPWLRHK